MAAPTKPDWAYFTVVQNDNDKTLVFTRIADPHHRSSLLQAVAYIDAIELDQLVTDGKATAYPLPGAEALANIKPNAITTLVNRHTYTIKFA